MGRSIELRLLAALAALPSLLFVLAPPSAAEARGCVQPAAKREPPCNPHLAQSPWSASHRGSYAQGSSHRRGLETAEARTRHVDLPGIPISIQFSERYADGGRAAWGSLIDSADRQALFKVDVGSGELIDLYVPEEREDPPPSSGVGGITGSYSMLDRKGRFIVPRQRWIDVYGDARRGARRSPIELRKRFHLPPRAFCGTEDRLVGATMTYDGYIAFVSERGVVGTVPRQPGRMSAAALRTLNLNAGRCRADGAAIETVSNSLAADEDGGIYVVTSKRMRRIDHRASPNRLRSRWSAPYETGDEQAEIRLGAGSGSTPSLMGSGRGKDRFVVITDGQELMHVVLYWRKRIPRNWRGLGGGRPRRMACEYPVRFGEPGARESLSEQSVAVRGHGTLHVDNALDFDFPGGLPEILRNAFAALRGGDPDAAPYGAERIDWKPRSRRCRSVWSNPRVSIPNGIPSISGGSRLAYGISQRGGRWGVRGLSWRTGRTRLFARAAGQRCSPEAREFLADGGLAAVFDPILDELPRSCENSFYAATEIGPNRSIWTGTFLGLTIYSSR